MTVVPDPSRVLRSPIDRLGLPPQAVLVGTALVVGLGAGGGAVLFRYLIAGVGWLGYQLIPELTSGWGSVYVVLVPAGGGLLVGLLVYFFAPEAKGHGVPEVMEAVALRGGRIRPVVAVVKAVASSICIGSGGSAGREGPIVQIGSSLGSTVAQALRLSEDRTANLVACGAAGGIAATFNAPIAGVVFALEVILGGRFSVRYFSTVVVSAVAASVVGRIAFGDVPAFNIPAEYGVHSLWEYLLYPLLGVLAGLAGVLFVRVLYGMEDLFDRWRAAPEWLKPAVGGALLGVVALGYRVATPADWSRIPQVFNVGYDVIESALANRLTLDILATLLLLKLLATALTLGSGGSGGVFAPALFMGAMLGGAFELVAHGLFPGITAPAGAYSLVGMAAVFAAAAHAPMTAVLILFELTGDYRIILPLMLTVGVATLLAQHLLREESIYTLKLSRRGVRLQRGRDIDLLESVRVAEVMTEDIQRVTPQATVAELGEIFSRRRVRAALVVDADGKLRGIVTDSDRERAIDAADTSDKTVAEIATPAPELLCAFPDETMGDALHRMAPRGIGRMPVVSRQDPQRLLGLIRRHDIIRAYDLAGTRRAEMRSRAHPVPDDREAPDFIQIVLDPGATAIGKSLRDLSETLPENSIVVSIRRGGKVIIPHGATHFRAGDQVTAFAHPADVSALRRALTGKR